MELLPIKNWLISLFKDRSGNVALTTAIITPVILTAMLGGVNVTMALSMRQQLQETAQIACTRAVKPLRMKLLEDDDRTSKALATFDTLDADKKLKVISRSITYGWLTANVKATVFIPTLVQVQEKTGFTISVDVSCEGLPPFPKKNDVILSSNFVKPDGDAIAMKYGWWGIHQPAEFGWKPGKGQCFEIQKWDLKDLPAGSKSP